MQFNFGKPKAVEAKVKRETIIPEPSYSIPIALTGVLCMSVPPAALQCSK